MNINETGRYIVHLVFSVLNSTNPSPKPEGVSFEDIYNLSGKHNLTVICLHAIEKLDEKPEEELYEKWKKKAENARILSILQMTENENILKSMTDHEIRCLPLKGILLKEMYPMPELRETADLDILIDKKDQQNARIVMEQLGYEVESFDQFNEDSYRKVQFVHVEMHNQLVTEFSADQMNGTIDEIKHPFEYSIETDRKYEYRMTDENFYIFLIVHLAKHYLYSGVGIRPFADIYLFRKIKHLNYDYIASRLEKMGLLEFAENVEKLIQFWLSGQDMSDELYKMENMVFSSGSFGNAEGKILNIISKGKRSSISYALYRIFPPYHLMILLYPTLRRRKICLPVYWLHRLVFKGIPGIPGFAKEMETFRRIRNKEEQ